MMVRPPISECTLDRATQVVEKLHTWNEKVEQLAEHTPWKSADSRSSCCCEGQGQVDISKTQGYTFVAIAAMVWDLERYQFEFFVSSGKAMCGANGAEWNDLWSTMLLESFFHLDNPNLDCDFANQKTITKFDFWKS